MASSAQAQMVVIGGSAGSIQALGEILPTLDLPIPVVVILHVAATGQLALTRWFSKGCLMNVVEVNDKDRPMPNTIHLAPADYHLLLERSGCFALSTAPKVNHSRPSIDVFLEDASAVLGSALVAVITSGANDDGASGCRGLAVRGGRVVVQDPGSCEFPMMPQAALARVTPEFVGTPSEIRTYLNGLEEAS